MLHSLKIKTFVCRLINNFYNRRFRAEVCLMKGAILQQCQYLLHEGVLDNKQIEEHFLELQRSGKSSTYIDAVFSQACAEISASTLN